MELIRSEQPVHERSSLVMLTSVTAKTGSTDFQTWTTAGLSEKICMPNNAKHTRKLLRHVTPCKTKMADVVF